MSGYSSWRRLCAPSRSKAEPLTPGVPSRRRRSCPRFLIVLAALAVGGGAAAEGPIDRLESLGRVLRQEHAWRATYQQEYLPAGMTVGEQDSGTVWVAWPDRAFFRFGTPVVREMGMEGRRVRLVDLDVASCDDHRIDEDEWQRIPLAAVLDPRSALDGFTILENEAAGFSLIPHDHGGVARVDVTLKANKLPDEVVVTDPQGATNRLKFGEWQAEEGPPDGKWLPVPPAGMECVSEEP